jgi:PAS domain S-box-containing protein
MSAVNTQPVSKTAAEKSPPKGVGFALYATLSAAFSHLEDWAIVLSPEGEIVVWNKGAESLFGRSFEDVRNKNISIIAPPGADGDPIEMFAQVLSGHPVAVREADRVRKDGIHVRISERVSPVEDHNGQIYGVLFVARDLTRDIAREGHLNEVTERQDEIATLRACRDGLKAYPGPLPYLQGYNESRKLFHELWQNDALGAIDPGDAVQRLAAIDAVLADKGFDGDPANVPLHGGAHLGNMLVTDDQPDGTGLWIDWEDVSRGPVEWDYACLIVSLRDDPSRSAAGVAMMADIAGETDRDCLYVLIDARALQRELWDTATKVLHLREGAGRGLASRGFNFLSRKLQRQ